MKAQTIYLDMDGTLATWSPAKCFEQLLEPNYFRNLTPYQNVVDAIKMMADSGFSIWVLSAVLEESRYAIREKHEWLDQYAPFLTNRLFCSTDMPKHAAVQQHTGTTKLSASCVLLDDYSNNLHQWSAAGGTSIKLLNGINGTKGTWTGPSVSRFEAPELLYQQILHNLSRNA